MNGKDVNILFPSHRYCCAQAMEASISIERLLQNESLILNHLGNDGVRLFILLLSAESILVIIIREE